MPGIQRNFNSHGAFFHIHHLKAAPGFLCKHNLLLKFIHKRLNIRTLLLIRHQNPFRGGGDYHIVKPHDQNRHVHFVYDVYIGTVFVHNSLADNAFLHGLGKGVPGAKILPLAGKTLHLNLLFLLHHSIVKGDFRLCLIAVKKSGIVCAACKFPALFDKIPELKRKHPAVPQSSLTDIFPGSFRRRFFLKSLYGGGKLTALRNDITVLFRRICGFNPHQYQVCLPLLGLIRKTAQCLKIVLIYIRIHRTHHHRFIHSHMHHIF